MFQRILVVIFLFTRLHHLTPAEESGMMVNFMCELDQAIECPVSWLNIILGVSAKVFPDEINI